MSIMQQVDFFVHNYINTMIWSSCEEGDEDAELSPEAQEEAEEDCREFMQANQALLEQADAIYGLDMAAHDFSLTRNGHGAGYWDGDLPEALGAALTKAAKDMGQQQTYMGDDGLLYLSH